MIRAEIILTFKSGQKMGYANLYLENKSGDDGADNLKHKGKDGYYYCYTGSGDDTYDDQTGLGKIKGDYEFFVAQIGGTGLLNFPEGDSSHSSTTEYVRKGDITKKPFDRFTISATELVGVAIDEKWARYPETDNRESGYMLPKDSEDFAGFRETDYITDRGPDFDEYKTYDDGFIPNPILKIKDDGNVEVVNSAEFDSVEVYSVKNGFEAYGIKDDKKSGITFLRVEG